MGQAVSFINFSLTLVRHLSAQVGYCFNLIFFQVLEFLRHYPLIGQLIKLSRQDTETILHLIKIEAVACFYV